MDAKVSIETKTKMFQNLNKNCPLDIFLFALLTRVSLWGTIKRTNKSELWNRLSYRGLPYFFEVGSQTYILHIIFFLSYLEVPQFVLQIPWAWNSVETRFNGWTDNRLFFFQPLEISCKAQWLFLPYYYVIQSLSFH